MLKYNPLHKRGVSVFDTPLLCNTLKISALHFTPISLPLSQPPPLRISFATSRPAPLRTSLVTPLAVRLSTVDPTPSP